ncbi:MAG: hypothetical protein ACLR3S_08300, partial [Clostridium fessum]
VILLEGILVLYDEALRNLLDIRIFVDADADERILRRILRDTKERGRDIENIIDQYLTTVKPMHALFVEPTRAYADVVTNSGRNEVAFSLVRGDCTAAGGGEGGRIIFQNIGIIEVTNEVIEVMI